MNAQQAWQSVLQQLQLDMAKASFDKWVRDTGVISFDGDVLTISAPSEAARDWLDARLKSTVQRLLIGILDREVAVQFAADQQPNQETDESELQIEPVQWLDYDRVVQPHRQVVVKGYLRRLGTEIGPKAIWLYIGFHQAAWMAHDAGGNAGAILHSRDVMRFSGLSTGAFWRALKNPALQEGLRGLVQRIDPADTRRYRQGRDGRPHRIPVRYQVFMTPRLTSADASALVRHLQASLEQGSPIEQALAQCLAMEDVLSLLEGGEKTLCTPPLYTVMEIAGNLARGLLSPAAGRMAQELNRRILSALGDIHITHHFITHGIREFELTPAQAWLVTIARDLAYFNARTGERREVVTFRRGYEEIAELVGSTRPKTIQAWFSPEWAAHRWGGNLGPFMAEIEGVIHDGYADLRTSTMPRTFRVWLEEPLDVNGGNRLGADGSNRVDANGSHRLDAAGGNMVGADGGVNNSFKHPLSTDRENTSNTANAAAGARSCWDVLDLLQRNHVHPSVQKQLLEAEMSAQALVSWILFSASREGKWVSDPLAHAISRLRAEPRRGAGPTFDRLAALPPARLQALIDRALENPFTAAGQIVSHQGDRWPAAMTSNPGALMTVRDILFGKGGNS